MVDRRRIVGDLKLLNAHRRDYTAREEKLRRNTAELLTNGGDGQLTNSDHVWEALALMRQEEHLREAHTKREDRQRTAERSDAMRQRRHLRQDEYVSQHRARMPKTYRAEPFESL